MRFKIYDETFNLKNQKFSILPDQNIKLTSKDINYSFLNKNYTLKLNTSFHYLKTNNVDGINHKYIIFDKETKKLIMFMQKRPFIKIVIIVQKL